MFWKPSIVAVVAGLLAVPAMSRADSLLEKIAVAVLADKFGLDTREVIVLHEQTALPVYELAPICEGAHYFHRSPRTVWQLRQQGLGWGQIAHQVGMHPGTFNKLRKQGAFDRDRFWTNAYSERFAVPTQRVVVLHRAGGTLEDVLGAIIVSKLTKQDPQRVYDQFRSERSWSALATTNNVRFEDWRRVSTPVRSRYTIVSVSPKSPKSPVHKEKAHGAGKGPSMGHPGKGNGNGNGKAKGHANGNGHGNGNAKGKGHGNGNVNGHGKGKGGQ